MVVFLDLDEDAPDDDPHADPNEPAGFASLRLLSTKTPVTAAGSVVTNNGASAEDERSNPNINSFSAALGCYPIITLLTHHIDLNTLHALSHTCRQIRFTLLQYRNRLVRQTLRCENESINLLPQKQSGQRWHILGEAGHLVSGKISTCARDLVSDCRRCGRVVCRNCTLKPPSPSHLPSRHRRLCPTCLSVPLSALTKYNSPAHSPCTCPSVIHLCAPCGASLATADTTYKRVWTWRTRYSTYLGGLGTGIGEGNEGVKCARGRECTGGIDVEVEFECSSSASGSNSGSESGSDAVGDGRASPWGEKEEAGYWRQEIEGLGGVVKKKFRKKERVGATVKEWENEREGMEDVLGREKRGEERSWCGWCGRVVMGGSDLECVEKEKRVVSFANERPSAEKQ